MSDRDLPRDHIHQPRRDSMYEERVHDPYQVRRKWHEPTLCPDCKAVFHRGRWQWAEAPEGAERHRCPACARMHDRIPAGFLTVGGAFFADHKDEILHLIRNHETKEKQEHPLERIMEITEEADACTISFTGSHLAKGAGEALHHAYQGDLHVDYNDKDAQTRVQWHR